MLDSALLGQQPTSDNDNLVYKGLLETSPLFFHGLSKISHVSHHSRAPSMIIGTSFAIAFAIIITCSRLWIRMFRSRAFGADDIVIIPAAIGCVAYLALVIASERAGCLGKHIYDCTYKELGWFYELAHCDYPIFYFTVFLVKISIVLANRRITGMTSKKWQIAHWTYLALLMSILPICVFLNIFTCLPVATSFTLQAIAKVPDPRTIKCLNLNSVSLATRILHIITDWLLLPVPIIIIWRLQMPVSRKIRLMLVFCVGVISSIASVMRNILISRATLDLTYDYYELYAWDVVDVFFATIVASLPALNGVVDAGIVNLRALASTSSLSIFGKIRAFSFPSQGTGAHSSRQSEQGAGTISKYRSGAAVEDKKWRNNSDQFDEPILRRETDIELQLPGEHLGH